MKVTSRMYAQNATKASLTKFKETNKVRSCKLMPKKVILYLGHVRVSYHIDSSIHKVNA